MIGRQIDPCPCCGSRACAVQAKGPVCRHTRRPRPAALTGAAEGGAPDVTTPHDTTPRGRRKASTR